MNTRNAQKQETAVYRIRKGLSLITLLVGVALFAGCSSSTGGVAGDSQSAADSTLFRNILVIGVASDYEGRAQFERQLVSELKAAGTTATAMYVAAGGNKPIEQQAIEDIVSANGFDAVLISHVVNRDAHAELKEGSVATKSVRKGGGIDLFRYDYEEVNEPKALDVDLSVTITTGLYDASSSQRVWAIESAISDKDYIEQLISDAADIIVRGLKKDRLIRH